MPHPTFTVLNVSTGHVTRDEMDRLQERASINRVGVSMAGDYGAMLYPRGEVGDDAEQDAEPMSDGLLAILAWMDETGQFAWIDTDGDHIEGWPVYEW